MQSERTDALRGRILAHVRAIFVVTLVGVCLISAMPMPGPGARSALEDPAGKQELAQWVSLLGGIGIQTDQEELGDIVMAFSKGSRGTRRWLLTPFRPLFRITAAQQGWGLFAYPDTHPHSLLVTIKRDDKWSTVYDSADPEKRWSGHLIHYRRIRATYNPAIRPPSSYSGFVTWIAARAFAEDPSIQAVAVKMRRSHTVLPGEPPDESRQKIRWTRVRYRDGKKP